MANDKKSVAEKVTEIVKPIIENMGLELWDVEFKKEGVDWCLTIFIDKNPLPEKPIDDMVMTEDEPIFGVSLNDCENVSRAVDGSLDEADPIENSYYLQVFTPGINRKLIKEAHFLKYINSSVQILLIRPVADDKEKKREIIGVLKEYSKGQIKIEVDGEIKIIQLKDVSFVKLND